MSLDLPAGSALGLLGRNGMGKTTLIRALMGFVPVLKAFVAAVIGRNRAWGSCWRDAWLGR